MIKQHRSNERGDATAVVIVALVVALVGVLGFVAWQNFAKDDDKQPGQPEQIDSESDAKAEKTLKFDEWGVEIPLNDDTDDLAVKKTNDRGYEWYDILVPESRLFNDSSKTGTVVVGGIARHKLSDQAPFDIGTTVKEAIDSKNRHFEGAVVVGDYAYVYTSRTGIAYDLDANGKATEPDKKLAELSTTTVRNLAKNIRETK